METAMSPLADQVLGLEVGSTSAAFLVVLAVHLPAGLFCVITGAAAALTPKTSPRHLRLGRAYYRGLIVVGATAVLLAAQRWDHDAHLLALAVLCLLAATTGVVMRRRNLSGHTGHIVAMGSSYVVLLTAFYVDNGPSLPGWRSLPTPALWLLPSVIAVPLIWRAVRRHRSPRPTGQPASR
jgi:hypothetical protein